MKSNVTFQNGMVSDISKLFQSPNTYLSAKNLRPLTDLGSSNGSLVNIKGNKCEISFPNIRATYKLAITKIYNTGVFQPGSLSITINGITTSVITITESTTTQQIANILNVLVNSYNNPNSTNPVFATAYSDDYIVIYQNPIYTGCESTNSVNLTITINTALNVSRLQYVLNDNTLTNVFNANIAPSDPNIVIIGSTYINETIYLYTTPKNVFPQTKGLGQIWELTYNEITKLTSIKLLYNNYLNFSVDFPIAPSATIGRYETENIQRIYWTDFNNPVRSLNAKDPNLMALDVDLLNLRSSIQMSVPTLYDVISNGAVNNIRKDATYQVAYRLLKNNGGITNYSVLSNIIYPVGVNTNDFSSASPFFSSIEGSTGTFNKSFEFEVQGVDTKYDIIEFIIIIREAPNNSTFSIFKYEEQIINSRDTITSIFRNDTANFTEITLSEFLIENTAFTHAKTIETKDNRLFFANVKNDLISYLDTYDTRTFRFKQNSNIIPLKLYETDNTITNTTIVNTSSYNSIPENTDSISAYNLGLSTSDDSLYDLTSNCQINSSIIGGTGPNISYKFGTILISSDSTPQYPLQLACATIHQGTERDGVTEIYSHGYKKPSGAAIGITGLNPFLNGAPFQTYRQNNIKMTMGLEYLNGEFKTGELNEIYRYGILFYSKTASTDFVKWVGDIKFPNYNDLIAPGLAGIGNNGFGPLDHRSLYFDGTEVYSNVPYIQFDINIPDALSKLIDGYEIVRCLRKEEDKTITSQGLINQVSIGVGSESANYFLPISHTISDGGEEAMDPDNYVSGNANARATGSLLTFHPFDSLVNGNSNKFETNDKLIITEKYSLNTDSAIQPGPNPGSCASFEEYYYIRKYYNLRDYYYLDNTNNSISTLKIKEAQYVSQGGNSNLFTVVPGIYKNYDYALNNSNPLSFPNKSYAEGSPTIVIGLDPSTQITWNNYNDPMSFHNVVNGDSKLLAIHFKPSKLKLQYNGRTYNSRASSEYISCGAYYPVLSAGTKTIKVFGGDIYYGILDIQKAIKNWVGQLPSAPTKHSQTWYFPTHSVYNLDLRQGFKVNSDLDNDTGSKASGFDEYLYTQSYSYENTLKTYIPKPIFFNETNTFNNRVYWSEVKINAENTDSWTTIPVNNYYDVEGAYGGINALVILKNNMYFLQDKALGLLLINPYEVITTQNNQALGLGSGNTVQRHNYMSIDTGTKHQWSVYKSENNITFCDIRHKKLYLFDGESLNSISDIKGQRGFLNKVLHDNIIIKDNPITGDGILTTYDFYHNEFLYTFSNTFFPEKYTLCYSDLLGYFTSYYDFTPYIYINNHNKLYSPKLNTGSLPTKLYMHNIGNYGQFYDINFSSTIKVNFNDNPNYTKAFDSLSWNSESIEDSILYIDDINDYIQQSDNINYLNDTFGTIRCYNEYQNTDYTTMIQTGNNKNIRRLEQSWNTQIPRNRVNYDTTNINTKSIFDPTILTKLVFGERIRDKYMIVDLLYNNDINNRFIINNIQTEYRISDR